MGVIRSVGEVVTLEYTRSRQVMKFAGAVHDVAMLPVAPPF
jgi:hypothetical protein